jgi:hypothetical protein
VVVSNSDAIRENAGRYMSTANGVMTLSAPRRTMMNQFAGLAELEIVG